MNDEPNEMFCFVISKTTHFDVTESVTQSKVSQKEKKYIYISAYMWDLEKWYRMNLFLGQEWIHGCRDWTWGHSRGRGG